MKFTTNVKNVVLFPLDILYDISPEITLKILFRIKTGRWLNLDNPMSYNEKIQWIKLNYKNPIMPKLVDKYTVREYINEKCPEILNKLLWYGFDAKKIPWETLPEKFVIKVTHGSGYNIICTNKQNLDRKDVIRKLNQWLKESFLKCYGEWFYGIEKPRIIIEEYLDNGTGTAPEDYKVFCFDGNPQYIAVDTDRFSGRKRNIYDAEWNFLDGVRMRVPNDIPAAKPKVLEKLLEYASVLSEGFPHVRVDFYIISDQIYFGEMTFTNGAGFTKITPYEFDLKLGESFKVGDKYEESVGC